MSKTLRREDINTPLVAELIRTQFPQWADLPIRAVEPGGWDNKTFRLGKNLSVRLPTGPSYAAQVEKEQTWLPRLAPHLPVQIPEPIGNGTPSVDFPFPWSIYRWIEGEIAKTAQIDDLAAFATDLADFLGSLYSVEAGDGPPPGMHSSFRGCSLQFEDPSRPFETPGNWGTREAIAALDGRIDAVGATEVWEAGLASTWVRPPVWVHGDVAPDNLLVRNGRLCAVIDFGCSAVGDPACDLVIAWTFFSGKSRDAFRAGLALDEDTWARGRAWALWKPLYVLSRMIDTDPERAADAQRVIDAVLQD